MKKLSKLFLSIILFVCAIVGVMNTKTYQPQASSSSHIVTFNYNVVWENQVCLGTVKAFEYT